MQQLSLSLTFLLKPESLSLLSEGDREPALELDIELGADNRCTSFTMVNVEDPEGHKTYCPLDMGIPGAVTVNF